MPLQDNLRSKFYGTVKQNFHASYGSGGDEKPSGSDRPFSAGSGDGMNRQAATERMSPSERYHMRQSEYHAQAQKNPDRVAAQAAYYEEAYRRGTPPRTSESVSLPRVTQTDINFAKRQGRGNSWRNASTYKVPSSEQKSPRQWIDEELPQEHKDWINSALEDQSSPFNKGIDTSKTHTGKYAPGVNNRLRIYTEARQRGDSHEAAMQAVGRKPGPRQGGQRPSGISRQKQSGRATKFSSTVATNREAASGKGFQFGIEATATPKMDDLKKKFPNMTDRQLIQVQQADRQAISSQLLANNAWAQETKRANMLGEKSRQKENPDRITIFTTNLGKPSVSIPSDSLVGQYVINKRKSVLRSQGYSAAQLKGKFPDAVRDQHIIEMATGVQLQAEGRQGVYNSTGFRFGKRSSPGFGKARPVGGQVIYDSSTGRPSYDEFGNVRYSEGATRPFKFGTPAVGARILIG